MGKIGLVTLASRRDWNFGAFTVHHFSKAKRNLSITSLPFAFMKLKFKIFDVTQNFVRKVKI